MKINLHGKGRIHTIVALSLLVVVAQNAAFAAWGPYSKCAAPLTAPLGDPVTSECQLTDGECKGDCTEIRVPQDDYPDGCTGTWSKTVCVPKGADFRGSTRSAPCVLRQLDCHCPLDDPNLIVASKPSATTTTVTVCDTVPVS